MCRTTPSFRNFSQNRGLEKPKRITSKRMPFRNILMVFLFTGLITTMSSDYLEAQEISLRYASTELMTEDPFTFARSLQAFSRSEEVEGVVCAVFVFDSEGQNWGAHVSREHVRFDSGGPLNCWSPELREALPAGSFGRQDRILPQGLIINADYLTAHTQPVMPDSPIPPQVLAEELNRSTPNLEELAESVGHYPPQMPRHISNEPRWVAASFVLIPVMENDDRMMLSRDFQSTPVTVLLGGRER
jgi:hypothetical protein